MVEREMRNGAQTVMIFTNNGERSHRLDEVQVPLVHNQKTGQNEEFSL